LRHSVENYVQKPAYKMVVFWEKVCSANAVAHASHYTVLQ